MSKNTIVILSDEHQARALGCAGHPFVQTPHLDRLATSGMRFTNAYTPSPICVPARAAFATGQYPHQTSHWDNAMAYSGTPTGWGHQLQDAGIAVESIGKLHYRSAEDDAGFDQAHIPMMIKDGVGMIWASIRHLDERLKPPSRMLGTDIGSGESAYTKYDRTVTARTVEWLENRPDDEAGWCLYVGLVAPHFPLVCPQEFYDLYADVDCASVRQHPDHGFSRHPWVELQNEMMDSESDFKDADERHAAFVAYYGLISWMDHNVGAIMGALDATGLADTTTIIYSSDHGDNAGQRGLWGKSTMYEESAAIPLIMAGPDVPVGVCETPVSLLDISATIPNLFGLPADPVMQGRPLNEICAEAADENRVVFSEYHAAGAVSGAFMVRNGALKLIHYVGFEPELFDLANDPFELVNQATNPAYADDLAALYTDLENICNPAEIDAKAHAEQRSLVDSYGGLEAVRDMGPKGATPPPAIAGV